MYLWIKGKEPMKSAIKLFLILISLVTFIFAWFTDQLGKPEIRILILGLLSISLAVFLSLNLMEHREERRRRASREKAGEKPKTSNQAKVKHSDAAFVLREKKSGLRWGGGNIKASEATRGTRRKFLGK